MKELKIVLASASPRRRELLADAGLTFEIHTFPVKEKTFSGAMSKSCALENAILKASAAADHFSDRLVIGADTVVELDHRILGKPASPEEAFATLKLLSGKTHQVVTGVAMILKKQNIFVQFADVTEVCFKAYDDAVIQEYLSLVKVSDKAGSYGIQERGEMLVDHIDGLFSNVMGLPVERIMETLQLNNFR